MLMQLADARREAEALAAAKDALAREAEELKVDNQGLLGKAVRADSLSLEAEALRQQVGVGCGLPMSHTESSGYRMHPA